MRFSYPVNPVEKHAEEPTFTHWVPEKIILIQLLLSLIYAHFNFYDFSEDIVMNSKILFLY